MKCNGFSMYIYILQRLVVEHELQLRPILIFLFFLFFFKSTCRDMVCVDDIVDITPVDDGPTSYQGTLGQGIGTVNIIF